MCFLAGTIYNTKAIKRIKKQLVIPVESDVTENNVILGIKPYRLKVFRMMNRLDYSLCSSLHSLFHAEHREASVKPMLCV
jgi:hypothetical protein